MSTANISMEDRSIHGVDYGECDSNVSTDSEDNELNSYLEDDDTADVCSSNSMSLYHRVRRAIQTIRRSGRLRDAFRDSCRFKKIRAKQLVLDME
ncbi:unnamed protein product, partial [Allacma fusca]